MPDSPNTPDSVPAGGEPEDTIKRAHARFSPSSLKAKAICPGFTNDNTGDKKYADRGTLGHKAVEENNPELVNDDPVLKTAVKRSLEYKRMLVEQAKRRGNHQVYQEVKLRYHDQWGFADFLILSGKDQADLVDWKFAHNAYAADSPQFHAYALGIWDKYSHVESIRVHVAHPFINEIDVETFTRTDHYETLSSEIASIIARGRRNDPADYRVSSQCAYCGMAGRCAKLAALGSSVAARYLGEPVVLPEGSLHGSEISDPSAFASLLRIKPAVEKAAKSWSHAALGMYDDGVEIPGFEVQHSAGRRTAADAQAVYELVKDKISLPDFLSACTPSIPDVIDLVRAIAPRGGKQKAEDDLMNTLLDADLLSSGVGGRFLKPAKK